MASFFSLALLLGVEAAPNECPSASKPTSCASEHTCCADSFSDTKYGCCTLPNAVCCNTGAPEACCPEGSTCTAFGCSPATAIYPCGPVQGENCTESYVCHPGPVSFEAGVEGGSLLIMGDSVSIGYIPHLRTKVKQMTGGFGAAIHTPGAGDGGARSTSTALQCMQYYLSTTDGTPLPLTSEDTIAFNYGLHDYNYGFDGVQQYSDELKQIVSLLQTTPARLVWIATSPAHNVDAKDSHGDDTDSVIVELNRVASAIMAEQAVPVIDTYTAVMDECGPVPFEDKGDNACSLCAPRCNQLSVHYSSVGYEFIASFLATELQKLRMSYV